MLLLLLPPTQYCARGGSTVLVVAAQNAAACTQLQAPAGYCRWLPLPLPAQRSPPTYTSCSLKATTTSRPTVTVSRKHTSIVHDRSFFSTACIHRTCSRAAGRQHVSVAEVELMAGWEADIWADSIYTS
jgi:hypothetical protein